MSAVPQNVHVSSYSEFSKRAAASWDMDGARFHVWFDTATMEPDRERIIYKNPPEGLDRNDPLHFNTRKLDALLPKNAAIVKQVFEEIERRRLLDAAAAEAAQKEKARQAAIKESRRQELIKAAAPRLVEALLPFATFAAGFGEHAREDGWVLAKSPSGKRLITMGDVRSALAALRDLGEA